MRNPFWLDIQSLTHADITKILSARDSTTLIKALKDISLEKAIAEESTAPSIIIN